MADVTHVTKVTFEVDEARGQLTVMLTCDQGDGSSFVWPIAHLASLAQALVGASAVLGKDLSHPARVVEVTQRAEPTPTGDDVEPLAPTGDD